MMIDASNVLTSLEQRIHDAAKAKADVQIQQVVRVFDGLGPVFDGCHRAKAVRDRALGDLKRALIERYSGEMVEELVGRLIAPPAAA